MASGPPLWPPRTPRPLQPPPYPPPARAPYMIVTNAMYGSKNPVPDGTLSSLSRREDFLSCQFE
jgi:hypothetical protein